MIKVQFNQNFDNLVSSTCRLDTNSSGWTNLIGKPYGICGYKASSWIHLFQTMNDLDLVCPLLSCKLCILHLSFLSCACTPFLLFCLVLPDQNLPGPPHCVLSLLPDFGYFSWSNMNFQKVPLQPGNHVHIDKSRHPPLTCVFIPIVFSRAWILGEYTVALGQLFIQPSIWLKRYNWYNLALKTGNYHQLLSCIVGCIKYGSIVSTRKRYLAHSCTRFSRFW